MELSEKNQEKVTGGSTIRQFSPEEQLARMIIAYKAKGIDKAQAVKELAGQFELPLARIEASVERYW